MENALAIKDALYTSNLQETAFALLYVVIAELMDTEEAYVDDNAHTVRILHAYHLFLY